MKPGLTLDVFAGQTIDQAAEIAQQLADKVERAVGFKFNSVRCVAQPGGSASKLTEMQQEAQRSELVVYSDSAKVEIELKWEQQ